MIGPRKDGFPGPAVALDGPAIWARKFSRLHHIASYTRGLHSAAATRRSFTLHAKAFCIIIRCILGALMINSSVYNGYGEQTRQPSCAYRSLHGVRRRRVRVRPAGYPRRSDAMVKAVRQSFGMSLSFMAVGPRSSARRQGVRPFRSSAPPADTSGRQAGGR